MISSTSVPSDSRAVRIEYDGARPCAGRRRERRKPPVHLGDEKLAPGRLLHKAGGAANIAANVLQARRDSKLSQRKAKLPQERDGGSRGKYPGDHQVGNERNDFLGEPVIYRNSRRKVGDIRVARVARKPGDRRYSALSARRNQPWYTCWRTMRVGFSASAARMCVRRHKFARSPAMT